MSDKKVKIQVVDEEGKVLSESPATGEDLYMSGIILSEGARSRGYLKTGGSYMKNIKQILEMFTKADIALAEQEHVNRGEKKA